MNHYSFDYIFKLLKFENQKEQQVDFISFSKTWIAQASIKGKESYETAIKSLTTFIQKDVLIISEITVSFLNRYTKYLEKRRDERNQKLAEAGKRIPTNRTISLYLGCIRHLYKEAQRKYNDIENNLMLIPNSPFEIFKIPRQGATRKRALDRETIRNIYALPYKDKSKDNGKGNLWHNHLNSVVYHSIYCKPYSNNLHRMVYHSYCSINFLNANTAV